jgi:hypothetical protein
MVKTAHNRIVNASPPCGGSGCVRLGRSLRSLPRLTPPQFASPANLTVCLSGLANRRLQPGTLCERQAKLIRKL